MLKLVARSTGAAYLKPIIIKEENSLVNISHVRVNFYNNKLVGVKKVTGEVLTSPVGS